MKRLLSAALLIMTLTANAKDDWTQLAPLPDKEGFAGSFAGITAGQLIVAGGTHFPDKRPWEGGAKIWFDTIYALDKPDGQWRKIGTLPQSNGYGVSLTTEQGVLCAGGGNVQENFTRVFLLRLEGDKLITHNLPPLPKPCAFMSGVRLGSSIYIAGGIETPTATQALNTLWTLDLTQPEKGWSELPPCPGPGRILATMAALDDNLYLFSGAALKADAQGKPEREWLKDAWKYQPKQGWKKIADLPRVAVAAPSPAPTVGDHILILGGDDGANVNFEPKEKHPGFPREILSYDPDSNQWASRGSLPFSLVTSPAVIWQGRVVISGGEARPGKRSPQIWSGEVKVSDRE